MCLTKPDRFQGDREKQTCPNWFILETAEMLVGYGIILRELFSACIAHAGSTTAHDAVATLPELNHFTATWACLTCSLVQGLVHDMRNTAYYNRRKTE